MRGPAPRVAIRPDGLPVTTHSLPEEVWARIRARVEVSIAEVEAAATRLFEAPLSPESREEVDAHARALSAWLSHLGIGAGATLVRQMAEALMEPTAGPGEAVRVAALAEDVRSALTTIPVVLPPAVSEAPLVEIHGDPTSDVDALLWNGVVQGLRVLHHDMGGLDGEQAEEPEALVVAGDLDECTLQMRMLRERHPTRPMVAVVRDLTDEGRVGLRRVADTVLDLDTHPATVATEVRRLLLRNAADPAIGLLGCGGDDLANALRARGAVVVEVAGLSRLAPLIRDGDVDAVVLGTGLSDRELMAVVQVTRADPSTRDAIMVVRGPRAGGVGPAELYRLGIDAMAGNTDGAGMLIAQLRGLVRRAQGPPVDPAQGRRVLPWSGGRLFLERLLQVSHRDDRTTSVAVITLPPEADPVVLDSIQDELATEFRTEDVVSRLDSQRQVVALQGVNRRTAIHRLGVVIQGSPLGRAGARAGVAEFPFDGRSVDELLRVAVDAVGRAHEHAGPVAVGADWMKNGAGAADVLLVDGDHTLTEVLLAQLRDRGLAVEALHDGVDALERLVHSGRPLPRVLVLEFDIPGVSGLQLLRRLREAGVMNRFRVMMMSGQARESDLRTAFELGAVEFVAKPFQSVVFGNRLRRLLEA